MIVENDVAPAHTGDPIYWGDELIGVVTSGEYGHWLGQNLALGYVDGEHAAEGKAFEISIIGTRCNAKVVSMPFFDPKHERPRG